MGHADPSVILERERSRSTEVENLTATCMDEDGFEYTPNNATDLVKGTAKDDLSEDQYAREHGFGIASELARSTESQASASPLVHDANASYIEGLSPAEKSAWSDALSKCQMEVSDTMATSGAAELNDVAVRLQQQVASEPEVEEALEDWRACMTERGFRYSDPRQMRIALADEFEAIAITTPKVTADGTIEPGADSRPFVDDASSEAIAAFFEREVETAVANVECDSDLTEVYTREARQAEIEYLESHPELRDKLSSS